MSSKQFYLSRKVAPSLVYRHEVSSFAAIEVWTTSCIVLNFGKRITMERKQNHHNDNDTAAAGPPAAVPSTATQTILLNPANPQLSGVSNFSYFPRGGPVPSQQPSRHPHAGLAFSSHWGGISTSRGMLLPLSVIDGMVHTYGGWELQAELMWRRFVQQGLSFFGRREEHNLGHHQQQHHSQQQESKESNNGVVACPVGSAVRTTVGGKLAESYDSVIHTAPPFYEYPPPLPPTIKEEEKKDNKETVATAIASTQQQQTLRHRPEEYFLGQCYANSFQLAQEELPSSSSKRGRREQYNHDANNIRLATPLLGAGCRGFPLSVAMSVACTSTLDWLSTASAKAQQEQHQQQQQQQSSFDNPNQPPKITIAFGLLEQSWAEEMKEMFQQEIESKASSP